MEVGATIMQPIQPMLAAPCKSVEMAFAKCKNGIYSEIKYDGERVQLHKKGDQIAYYSRSLKPVMPHKIKHFKDHLGKAFPHADELILDAEVLMIDNKTGVPLPFGTLGVHKAAGYADAQVWSLTQVDLFSFCEKIVVYYARLVFWTSRKKGEKGKNSKIPQFFMK